jgi:hypothetical protein
VGRRNAYLGEEAQRTSSRQRPGRAVAALGAGAIIISSYAKIKPALAARRASALMTAAR